MARCVALTQVKKADHEANKEGDASQRASDNASDIDSKMRALVGVHWTTRNIRLVGSPRVSRGRLSGRLGRRGGYHGRRR